MRQIRLLLFCLLSGTIAAIVGGFVTALLILTITLGLAGLIGSLIMAPLSMVISVKIAALPAMLIGGLIWFTGTRAMAVWAGAGALGGLGLYAVLSAIPDGYDQVASMLTGPGTVWIALVFTLAGVPTALIFRLLMDSLTAFDARPIVD